MKRKNENKIVMRKTVIILSVFVLIVGSCGLKTSKCTEITLQELNAMYDTHTTNHTIYFGSDSIYHYLGQSNLKGTKKYKLKKQELKLTSEFPLSEKRGPVLLLEVIQK